MKLEPYLIPKSFQSYFEQFEEEPDTAIQRLENHVEKRNTGAVGYFFLAWLHHKHGNNQKAIQAAWQAKVQAPGSKLMDQLHYYLVHPKSFDAWKPEFHKETFKRDYHSQDRSHPIQDLDSLIAKLSSVETKRIKPDKADADSGPDLSEPSLEVDDIVTETLAVIYEKQNNYQDAIETFKKLRKTNSSKKDYYDEEIFRLQQKIMEEDGNED
ncbi:MAG: hypothetical protein WEA56_14415 [Balneolaceae bacterium]